MDADPLLPSSSTSTSTHHLLSSSPLYPLPEDSELSSFSPPPSPPLSPSFKDRLIFGPNLPSPTFHPPNSHPISIPPDPPSPSPSAAPVPTVISDDPASAPSCKSDHVFTRGKSNLHRSRTAPAMAPLNAVEQQQEHPPPPSRPSIVLHAFLFLLAYLALGVAFYAAAPANFASSAGPTHPVADALYFCIVTLCTIGYGDITPATPAAKLFSISFVLVGFGFVDILLSGMVSYVLDLQEHLLIAALKNPRKASRRHRHHYIFDVKKGRMRVRMKVALALGVVAICVGVGAAVLRRVERLGWLDAVYLAVMSVTTVGYGDQAFRTLPGRLFASAWLLVSTLAVARAFLYLAEMRIDKRHRAMANWVLSRDMTVSEFLAADIDNNGYVTKSEFVVYKLKEMGKISEKDIMLICNQFQRLDTGNCGKITLSDLLESHHLVSDPREKK